jgi:hypothetical protein
MGHITKSLGAEDHHGPGFRDCGSDLIELKALSPDMMARERRRFRRRDPYRQETVALCASFWKTTVQRRSPAHEDKAAHGRAGEATPPSALRIFRSSVCRARLS